MNFMSEEDRRWQRQADARTLANAEQIKADKKRYSEAQKGAKEILQEEARRLEGLSKIASNPTVTKVVKKAEVEQEVSQPTMRGKSYPNPAKVGNLF